MKVRVCERVEIDTEVEVSIDAVLTMFAETIEEQTTTESRGYMALSVIDCLTRILQAVPLEFIERQKPGIRQAVADRIFPEFERWVPNRAKIHVSEVEE